MNHEIELLKRNLFFIRANQKRELEHDPVQYGYCEKVIEKISTLIESGKIKDIMGIEATYYYCMDKMNQESSKLDEYVSEITDFIG
jgi:hypothetical protein